jgi:DNA-binding NtrC family response regulator
LESELFGFEVGAFTGAARRRIGKLEQADGGTIFLDEIGDMSLSAQAKILRALQERSFQRLGGDETLCVDVRVIAATNRDLQSAILAGTFREDLYHRLNVISIAIPPLRERREDIPDLVYFLLARFARKLGCEPPAIADDALRMLCDYSWPGNVRQLEHCIQRAIIFTCGHPIQASDLVLEGALLPADERVPDEQALKGMVESHLRLQGGPRAYELFLERIERVLLSTALVRSRGNQTHAARLLGLSRPTLHAKIRKHGLCAPGGE